MRNSWIGVAAAALVTITAAAQGPAQAPPIGPATEQDKVAVKQAAFDYAEGYYEGAAERMERAVHPGLVKRGVLSRPGVGSLVAPMNAETLVELTRQGGGKERPADTRNISFALLDIRDNVASAKVFTGGFNDYLHLVKQEGRWRIVHVLWQPPVPGAAASGEADKAAVEQAVGSFVTAVGAGDAARIEQVVHPEAALRTFRVNPQTGRFFLVEGNRDGIVAAVKGRSTPPSPSPTVTVLDTYDTIASVMTTTAQGISYAHLARQNGQWRLVNRLSR